MKKRAIPKSKMYEQSGGVNMGALTGTGHGGS